MTAEIGPPRGADPDAIRRKVEPLRGWVDAVNITDNQSAFVRLSSWAGSLLALAAGVEPVMQLRAMVAGARQVREELVHVGTDR